MINYNIILMKEFTRPTFIYIDKYIKHNVYILYDTGAVISLWCGKMELLKSIFKCKDTGKEMYITGVGGNGRLCKIYQITLMFGDIILVNVPIAIFENADSLVDIILSRTVFENINILDYGTYVTLNVNTDKNHYFNMLSILSKDKEYLGVRCLSIINICPICGSKLLDNGSCININCDFSIER